jgi:hypothetical protein
VESPVRVLIMTQPGPAVIMFGVRPSRIRSRVLALFRRSLGIVATGSLAVLFAAADLLAPPMGRDLSAQVAHAELAEQHWPALLNLTWYRGFASCLLR